VPERWPLFLFAVAVAVIGLVVGLKPFDADIAVPAPNGGAVHGVSHCGVPARAAFTDSSDGGVWFAYAPGTTVYGSDGFGCREPAQRRTALGGTAILVAVVLAAIGLRWRTKRPVEASVS